MPLNTTNLISTPDITGNIGQCQSNATVVNGAERINFWVQRDIGKMVNSCTGQETTYTSWEFTDDAHTIFGTAMFLGIVILAVGLFAGFVYWMSK